MMETPSTDPAYYDPATGEIELEVKDDENQDPYKFLSLNPFSE